MKKRLLAWVLSFALALSLLPVGVLAAGSTVASGTCGDNLTWVLDSEGTLTISGEGWMDNYNEQDFFHGVHAPWSAHREQIESVIIEPGVTSIGAYSFFNCDNLSDVSIAVSVTRINKGAFESCNSLSDVTIPSEVTVIETSAFAGTNLSSIVIPDKVTYLGMYVFSGSKITSISLPKSIYLVDGLSLENMELENISVDDENEYYCSKDGVLYNKAMSSIIKYPQAKSGVAFTIPESVETIDYCAFEGCKSLTKVIIPENVSLIEFSAFEGCENLRELTIPKGVKSIGSSAFEGCKSLTEIIIPGGVSSIEHSVFEGCENLTELTIPESVETIGYHAFDGCRNLTEIAIPKGVSRIDGSAFEDCANLKSIVIPEGVSIIDYGTFSGCSKLEWIQIPASIEKIKSTAFYECKDLNDVYYSGSEAQWRAIDIYINENNELKRATIHYNSTGPDTSDPGESNQPQYILAKFTGYDDATKQVTLDVTDSTLYTYQVTEQTDLSFLDQLDALVGQTVLVRYLPGTYGGSDYLTRYVLSVSPANTVLGTLEAISETSVTVNGTTYPMELSDWENQEYLLQTSIGKMVALYFSGETVIDVVEARQGSGILNQGTSDSVTIDNVAYTALFLNEEVPPYLAALDLWLDHEVKYVVAGSVVYDIELVPYDDLYTKKLTEYSAKTKTVKFHDGSTFQAADAVAVDSSLLNTWVTLTVTTTEGGRELTKLEAVTPKLEVSFEMEQPGNIYLKDNKYSFNGTDYENSSSFEIPFRVSAKVSVPYASESDLALMAADDSLAITLEKVSVVAPDGFNFGWTGSGELGDASSLVIHPGDVYEDHGFLRPGTLYFVEDATATETITCVVDASGDNHVEKFASFTIINQDYLEEGKDQIEDLSKEAAGELGKLNVDSMIALNQDTMKEVFGLSGKDLELFREHMLVAIIMASASEDTFKGGIDQQVLKKVFEKYQPAVSASSKEIHLNYVFETERYGTLNVEFTFGNLQVGLDGTVFSIFGAIGYTIKNASRVPGNLKTGNVGQAQIQNVEAFGEAAYRVAEAEIKNAYNTAYGNLANQAAKYIFSQTIQDILKAGNKSFSDAIWKFATWPAKNYKNACPTDVFVYDKNGNLCGAIENNVITKEDSANFTLRVEGDVKYILGLDDDYTVQYVATGDGTMEVEATELLETNVPLRTVTFHNISITTGTTFTQESTPDLLVDGAAYAITAKTENGTTTTIEPDEDRIVVDFGTGGTPEQPEQPEDPVPPANPNYRIDIPAAEGGTVTADPAAAKAGAKVTLTATPDEGYAVGTITVTDRFGDAVKVTEQADGTYTFTMPNGQVTVKATFVETQEPAPAMPFTDVKEGDWFYDEVLYVYENGLMNGVGDNRFAPNSATTRGMLVTILYRLEGEPDVTGEAGFDDVGDTWYTDAVIWAAANDIVNGIGDNQFGPENTLTREQLVTMLYRYAQNKGYDVTASADLSGYPDAGQIQSWAQDAMTWAVAEGIVEGMDGNLNPAGSATRAQIATILMRFCEGVAK